MDEPVGTLTTQNTFIHPLQQNRTLSILELTSLFSYPDEKQFFGSLTKIQIQIGNYVPVKLAKAIADPIFAIHTEMSRNCNASCQL